MMTYTYDEVANEIHLKATGILRVNDPIDYFSDIEKAGLVKSPATEFVYFTSLEDIEFSYSDIQQIRRAFIKYNHGEKVNKAVFVTDNEYSFGMARMVTSVLDDVFISYDIIRTS